MLVHCTPALRSNSSASQQRFETNSKRHYSVPLYHRVEVWSSTGIASSELEAKSVLNLSKDFS